MSDMRSVLLLFMNIKLYTRQLKTQPIPFTGRKVSFSIGIGHLFKISLNCNEVQLSVANMGGVSQHTNSRCAKDVRMTHVGLLCVSVGEDWVKGWSTVNVSWSQRGFH